MARETVRPGHVESLYDRLRGFPPPDFSTSHPRPKTKADVARRLEKDEILVRHGMRPSVAHGR